MKYKTKKKTKKKTETKKKKKKKWQTYLLKQYLYQDLKDKKHKPVPRTKKLTHSAINVSIEEIDKFEEKEMMQKRPFARKTCNDFLVHRIPKHIIKHWVVLRKKLLVFLKQKQMNIIINVKKSKKKTEIHQEKSQKTT